MNMMTAVKNHEESYCCKGSRVRNFFMGHGSYSNAYRYSSCPSPNFQPSTHSGSRRRAFLYETLQGFKESRPLAQGADANPSLLEASFPLMSTEVAIFLSSCHPQAQAALAHACMQLKAMEKSFSRFRSDSELCRLNSRAGCGPQAVSKHMFEIIAYALELAKLTNGLVDPTILPALVRSGYGPGKSYGKVGYHLVHLDALKETIELEAGVALDLGGIAKGWMADRLAQGLGSYGASLVDLGGDLRAVGTMPWTIGVEDPWQRELDIEELQICDQGVATSSVLKRRWGERHHLIDPRSGRPSTTDLQAASVIAPSAGLAEAAAKAAILLGEKQALTFLEQGPYQALLMKADRTIRRLGL